MVFTAGQNANATLYLREFTINATGIAIQQDYMQLPFYPQWLIADPDTSLFYGLDEDTEFVYQFEP